jgi:hypothetical protein
VFPWQLHEVGWAVGFYSARRGNLDEEAEYPPKVSLVVRVDFCFFNSWTRILLLYLSWGVLDHDILGAWSMAKVLRRPSACVDQASWRPVAEQENKGAS